MARNRKYYEAEIHPTGRWAVYLINGDQRYAMVQNRLANSAEDAEKLARTYIAERLDKTKKEREELEKIKRFTVPAI